MSTLTRQERFILFCIAMLCLGLIGVSFFWNADKFFTSAYTPVVEESNERRRIEAEEREEQTSNQPQAPGFREEDIHKEQGDRYSTY